MIIYDIYKIPIQGIYNLKSCSLLFKAWELDLRLCEFLQSLASRQSTLSRFNEDYPYGPKFFK